MRQRERERVKEGDKKRKVLIQKNEKYQKMPQI